MSRERWMMLSDLVKKHFGHREWGVSVASQDAYELRVGDERTLVQFSGLTGEPEIVGRAFKTQTTEVRFADLAGRLQPSVQEIRMPSRRTVTKPATRIVSLTTCFLPNSTRDRYAEEFKGELFDLAKEGASRWDQAKHAQRIAVRILQLRIELTNKKTKKIMKSIVYSVSASAVAPYVVTLPVAIDLSVAILSAIGAACWIVSNDKRTQRLIALAKAIHQRRKR